MGTLIKLSDGEQIFLNSDADGVLMGIAQALEHDGTVRLPAGGHMPRGFLNWYAADGDQVVVNAAQIVSIRDAEATETT